MTRAASTARPPVMPVPSRACSTRASMMSSPTWAARPAPAATRRSASRRRPKRPASTHNADSRPIPRASRRARRLITPSATPSFRTSGRRSNPSRLARPLSTLRRRRLISTPARPRSLPPCRAIAATGQWTPANSVTMATPAAVTDVMRSARTSAAMARSKALKNVTTATSSTATAATTCA